MSVNLKYEVSLILLSILYEIQSPKPHDPSSMAQFLSLEMGLNHPTVSFTPEELILWSVVWKVASRMTAIYL